MECSRLMFPLLTVVFVIVYILFSLMGNRTIPKEASPSSTFQKMISAFQDNHPYSSPTVDTNSPPFFDFLYKSEQNCFNLQPYILILITSNLDNREKRDTIRYTWGGITKGEKWPNVGQVKDVKLLFLLGESQNTSLNYEVRKEALEYNDMMIGGFRDSYRNLTYKTLMGFKWMKTFCPQAQHVMKTDDDLFLDIPKIISLVQDVKSDNTIIGYFAGIEKPDRNNMSKSYVSETEYPNEWYPPHVKGCMYIMHRSLALNILNASERFDFLSMEDVFITGVLAESFHVNYAGIADELYDKNVGDGSRIDVCSFIRDKKLIAHNINEFTASLIWNRIEHPEMCTKNRFYRFQRKH